jgi:hypothetical protein
MTVRTVTRAADVAEATGAGRTGIVSIPETVRQLNSALGPTLVAALAGSHDPGEGRKWARIGGTGPGPEAESRLRLAHRAWIAVSAVEGENVARLWFTGVNPWLDGVSPIEAITNMRTNAVMAAAAAMTGDRFSG